MSGDTRKGQQNKKSKNDPKEQRKLRNVRPPANLPPEKTPEAQKVPEKPITEEPGPEFYKNLKRETDEILKITQESNAKYSKKVIQSNWQKYEAPIESYEEQDEVENMGADFEQLVNAPISSGGHFQFKHEKSWDNAIKASQYDKYFEINMTNLAINLSSIPFHERNGLDLSLFSQGDVTAMSQRSNKFKQRCQQNNNSEKENVDFDPVHKMVSKFKEILMTNEHKNNDEKETNNIQFDTNVNLKENVTLEKDANNKLDFNIDLKDNKCDEKEMISDVILNENKVDITDNEIETKNDTYKTLESKQVEMEADKSKDERKTNKTKDPEITKHKSDEELDMLLGTNEAEKLSVVVESSKVSDTEEDLEEWLDDFLST